MPEDRFDLVPIRGLDPAAIRDFAQRTWGVDASRQISESWWLSSEHAHAVAAIERDGGAIAGMVVGVPSTWPIPGGGSASTISICGWYVAPDFAGLGLGKLLVRSFDGVATALNAFSISPAAIRNFAKLGWTGPFPSQLMLLTLPGWRSKPRPTNGLELRKFDVAGGMIDASLAQAIDRVEDERPADRYRRRRTAQTWRSHLSVRHDRVYRFSLIERDGGPIGYFVSRAGDNQAGRIYRLARLHYVADVVLNPSDAEAMAFLASSIGPATSRGAGALLLTTSRAELVQALLGNGWLGHGSAGIGARLAEKAPQFMLAGQLAALSPEQAELTFTDSDVDLNI